MKVNPQIQKDFEDMDKKARMLFLQEYINRLTYFIKEYFPEEAEHIVISPVGGYNATPYTVDVHYNILIDEETELFASSKVTLILQNYVKGQCCFYTVHKIGVVNKDTIVGKYQYLNGIVPELERDECIWWYRENIEKLIDLLKERLCYE